MNYTIVYSSKSGNTALLAETLKNVMKKKSCIYYGEPDEKAQAADLIFIGFWTDKGSCDEDTAAFLKGLRNSRVFLFGTAGFGGSDEYFSQILSRVRTHIDSSNVVVGSYMCQGKMAMAVRERYEAMEAESPEQARKLLANFDQALSHPDEADLEGLKKAVAPHI